MSSRCIFDDSLSLRLWISLKQACMNGLKLVADLSREEIIHVESPKHDMDPKPPLYSASVLDRSLVQRSPDSSDLGIVNPALRGVSRALAATKCDMNS